MEAIVILKNKAMSTSMRMREKNGNIMRKEKHKKKLDPYESSNLSSNIYKAKKFANFVLKQSKFLNNTYELSSEAISKPSRKSQPFTNDFLSTKSVQTSIHSNRVLRTSGIKMDFSTCSKIPSKNSKFPLKDKALLTKLSPQACIIRNKILANTGRTFKKNIEFFNTYSANIGIILKPEDNPINLMKRERLKHIIDNDIEKRNRFLMGKFMLSHPVIKLIEKTRSPINNLIYNKMDLLHSWQSPNVFHILKLDRKGFY